MDIVALAGAADESVGGWMKGAAGSQEGSWSGRGSLNLGITER